jgi:hypothetical protein
MSLAFSALATTRFATAGKLLSIGNFAAHDVVPIPFVDEEDGKIP